MELSSRLLSLIILRVFYHVLFILVANMSTFMKLMFNLNIFHLQTGEYIFDEIT